MQGDICARAEYREKRCARAWIPSAIHNIHETTKSKRLLLTDEFICISFKLLEDRTDHILRLPTIELIPLLGRIELGDEGDSNPIHITLEAETRRVIIKRNDDDEMSRLIKILRECVSLVLILSSDLPQEVGKSDFFTRLPSATLLRKYEFRASMHCMYCTKLLSRAVRILKESCQRRDEYKKFFHHVSGFPLLLLTVNI